MESIRQSVENMIAQNENFLNVTCKISFKWFICEDSNQPKWGDLTGSEKLHLFNGMDIPNLFPSLHNDSEVQHVWSMFMKIPYTCKALFNSCVHVTVFLLFFKKLYEVNICGILPKSLAVPSPLTKGNTKL